MNTYGPSDMYQLRVSIEGGPWRDVEPCLTVHAAREAAWAYAAGHDDAHRESVDMAVFGRYPVLKFELVRDGVHVPLEPAHLERTLPEPGMDMVVS